MNDVQERVGRGRRRMLRRVIVWGFAVVVLSTIVWFAVRERPVLVDLDSATRGPLQVSVNDDGITRIRDRYVVSSPLDGRMRRIDHEVGDEVTASKTIVVNMEPSDADLLDPRAIAQAQARVRAAEQRLERAKAELKRVELLANFAEQEMGRLRKLRQANATSEKEFLQQELEYQQQQQNARAAAFAVEIAAYELELERAALLITSPPADGEDSTANGPEMTLAIPAPITGRILRLYQESAAVIRAGEPLLEVGDPDDLEVVADVLSRDAVTIRPGDRVSLERWGGAEPLDGRVRLVEPSGFTKISALGVEEQRVNVIIDLMQPSDERRSLGDNFRVDCRIVTWESDDVLRVPTSALFRDRDQWQLFTVVGNRAQRTDVAVGHSNGDVAEITNGIDEGDTIIVYPSESVEDGIRVERRHGGG